MKKTRSIFALLKTHPTKRRIGQAVLAAIVILFMSFGIARAYLSRLIDEARQEPPAALQTEIRIRAIPERPTEGWRLLLSAKDVRDAIEWEGGIWLATSGGLLELSDDGRQRLYTPMDGLPEADLTTLAIWNQRLIIGTASEGWVTFDGRSFTTVRPATPAARQVTALAADGPRVLIGTLGAGILAFDGKEVHPAFAEKPGATFQRVTAIEMWRGGWAVGTYDDGLYIEEGGSFRQIGIHEGLPSPEVRGLADAREKLLVATSVGAAAVSTDGRVTLLREGVATSVEEGLDGTWIGTVGHGVIGPDGRSYLSAATINRIRIVRGSPVFCTSDGALRISEKKSVRLENTEALSRIGADLAAPHVSAIFADDGGRAWIGYFRDGLEIRSEDRRIARHASGLEEVNGIVRDPISGRVWVASSQGATFFLGAAALGRVGEDEGLCDASVASIACGNGRVYFATAGGVTEDASGIRRSWTGFHGLPSPRASAAVVIGDRLWVGTLAGLAVLKDGRIKETFRPPDVPLPNAWVTALAKNSEDLYVGTPDGIARRSHDGVWSSVINGVEVSPGGLLVADGRLYAATLGKGLGVYELASGHWSTIVDGLPSLDVTSISWDGQRLLVGTRSGVADISARALEELLRG